LLPKLQHGPCAYSAFIFPDDIGEFRQPPPRNLRFSLNDYISPDLLGALVGGIRRSQSSHQRAAAPHSRITSLQPSPRHGQESNRTEVLRTIHQHSIYHSHGVSPFRNIELCLQSPVNAQTMPLLLFSTARSQHIEIFAILAIHCKTNSRKPQVARDGSRPITGSERDRSCATPSKKV
jgi:hypothetical protein